MNDIVACCKDKNMENNIKWNKCFICNKEFKNLNGSHLKNYHSIQKIEYLAKYRSDLEFTRKEILKDLYFVKMMTILEIANFYENKYNVHSLKSIIIDLFKFYELKSRNEKEAQKLFIEKNGLWNKGRTNETSES